MKNKITTLICIFICCIIVIWNLNVGAENISDVVNPTISISTPKIDSEGNPIVKANDQFSITVNVSSGLHNNLKNFEFKLEYDSSVFKFKSYSMGQGESKEETKVEDDAENGVVTAIYENNDDEVILTNGALITFRFEVKQIYRNEKFTFFLKGNNYISQEGKVIKGTCSDNINETCVSNTLELFIASTETRLQDLTLSEGILSPTFNGDITTYTATVDSGSVVINAVPAEKGTVKNIGTKGLNYGDNSFNIISTAEGGNTRIYKIIITRTDTRNTDNTLKSITGVNNFNKDVTEYNITLPSDESSFTAEAFTNDPKASIKYNPSSKRVLLDYGETKTITITVSAENGTKRDYVLNITKKDDRNTNNLLQSLTVSGATINFNPNTFSYRVMVDNKYSNVIINAVPQAPTSMVTGIGSKALNEGSNTFNIIVKSESGSEKIYSLVVIRKDSAGNISDLSNNTNLKYLRFKTLNTDLITNVDLKQGVYNYEISVPNSSEMVEILYETEDSKAIVSLEGNRDLNVGKNYYRIRVTAENGSTMIYSVTVTRQEIQNYITNNKNAILNAIKNSSDTVVTVSVEHNDNERIVDSSIISELKNSKKTLTFQVFNQDKKLDYSVSINSNNITETTSFDYRLTNITSNQSQIDALTNARKSYYLNFEGAKEIPGKIKTKVNIKDTFNGENLLTLYHYNESNGKLELVEDNIIVNNGYVEFSIEKIGNFVLIDKEQMKLSDADTSTILIVLGVILGIIVLIVIIKLIKRKRSIVKIPNISKENISTDDTDNKKET